MRFLSLLIIFFSLSFCLNCQAGDLSETGTHKIIHISIDDAAIPQVLLTSLTNRVGDEYSCQRINHDIHQLMNLGIFDDVIVTAKSTNDYMTVSYSFVKLPVISAWTNKIYSCSLKPPGRLTKLNSGRYFNEAVWFKDKSRIKEFYRENNYNNVTISSRVEKIKGGNKVVLFTDVYPGAKQFVKKINITGANDYEKDLIKSLLHFKPRNLWLFRKGSFSTEKLVDDENKIRELFVNSGFFDANVEISITNSNIPKLVDINIRLYKGPQYKLGKLIWNQQFMSSNDFAKLKNKFSFPEDIAYTPDIINKIREKINNYCVKITPQQLDLAIVPLISQESEPYFPVIDVIITLRKGRIGYENTKLAVSTFSYSASLAQAYLNE